MKKILIKKFVTILLAFIVTFVGFGDMGVAFAEGDTSPAPSADVAGDLEWANTISQVSDAFKAILYPILLMTGALIENDLLIGGGDRKSVV